MESCYRGEQKVCVTLTLRTVSLAQKRKKKSMTYYLENKDKEDMSPQYLCKFSKKVYSEEVLLL